LFDKKYRKFLKRKKKWESASFILTFDPDPDPDTYVFSMICDPGFLSLTRKNAPEPFLNANPNQG
jgi:hypothetical protein